MMSAHRFRNLIVVALGLAVTGVLRMPVEQKFTEDLRERKIITPKISKDVWGDLGQNSLAGTLGGMRTVMASLMSLSAQQHFEDQEWFQLEKDYELITALDPYNPFYWSHGGWHLGYNAASWARNNREFSPAKRNRMERDFLEKGDAFYRKGLLHLPENSKLWVELGSMWSNRFKRPDLPRAAEAFKNASELGSLLDKRRYLYVLAQIRGREIEAFEVAQTLLMENPRHLKFPTFRCIFFCLSTNPQLPADALEPKIGEIWRTKEQAYQELFNYRYRVKEDNFYGGELDSVLQNLITELDVPDDLNPFVNKTPRRINTQFWNKKP